MFPTNNYLKLEKKWNYVENTKKKIFLYVGYTYKCENNKLTKKMHEKYVSTTIVLLKYHECLLKSDGIIFSILRMRLQQIHKYKS